MGRNQEYDWIMAENHFVCSPKKCTLKDIADHYSIPHQSVRRYAAKHNWNQKREYTQCVIRSLVRMKVCEELYGLTIKDIVNDDRITWIDLAYLECERLRGVSDGS